MRNFRLITNAYKDKDLHLSRRIVSYIEDKGGRAGISVSNPIMADFLLDE